MHYSVLSCAYSPAERRSAYHIRNSWVFLFFIPLLCGLLFQPECVSFAKMMDYVSLVITMLGVCYIQGYGHRFFDGLRGVVSNAITMLCGWVGITFDIHGSNRIGLAFGYLCLMAVCLAVSCWRVSTFVLCFFAMCITAPNFAILICCYLLLMCITPVGDRLSRGLRYYYILLRLFIIPVILLSFNNFIKLNKFIFIPLVAFLLISAWALNVYIKSYFKRRFSR